MRTTDEEDGKELDAEGRACYRSWTMRAGFLGQDRCELQFAVKELAGRMQQPNTKNFEAPKRLVQFLKGGPRCLVVYNTQAEEPLVDVFSESDCAGCAKTRRSTSSSYVMLGFHLLAASATTQNVVATSSGEAEFYALTKSASSISFSFFSASSIKWYAASLAVLVPDWNWNDQSRHACSPVKLSISCSTSR